MALPKIIPALADLTQDIAGQLPLELLQTWATGNQNADEATKLLDRYRLTGTVVSSDTSGLSRLTEERDLLDVLALVSAPKQVLHGVGVAVGGRAIGIWTADNTEMFYPPSVSAGLVVDAMAEAQHRIAASSELRIGMCVHSGDFFEVGGGLYGHDAEAVERLAEDYAGPGVVLVTRAIIDQLGAADRARFTPCVELAEIHAPGVFELSASRALPDLRADARTYPYPFPDEFFTLLEGLRDTDQPEALRKRIYDAYLRERVIVFLAKAGDGEATSPLETLLDGFVSNALMETVLKVGMGAGDHVAGVGGGLGILTFDTTREAIDFSTAARARFADNGVTVKIGIDRGPVLVFSTQGTHSGISGDPVNIASKLSEDTGTSGRIRVSTRALDGIEAPPDAQPFEVTVSRIKLTGVEF